MPTDYQSRLNEQMEQARRATGDAQKAMPDKPDAEMPLTREEVQGVINSLVESIKNMVMAQESKFVTRDSLEVLENNILRTVYGRNYTTRQQALQIAKDAVPPSLYGLDSDETRKRGDTLKLIPGYPTGSDRAVWAEGGGGLSAEGDQVLYKGVFLREYDEAGVIVAIGSETTPLPEGHTLKPTWDVARWI